MSIKILPPQEAQKIAAGEVVERPASVIKELIENSLDACATHITLYIEQGGKKLIRIIDNGCGMNRDDALLCIAHHATSKITSIDELAHLSTFGFRGEALSSIAAVSHMKIITRTHDVPEGLQLTIEQGTVASETIVATNVGTHISIEDLFFNVPARKKFLKSDLTEWRAIQNLVYAYALDYPAIQFTLYHNNTNVLNCAATTNLASRVEQLFDQSITQHGIEVTAQDESIATHITGLITNHQYNRFDRSYLYCFVNNRWVKNYKLTSAIIQGYQNVLQQGKFPCAIISITIDPQLVDVNVHPRKEEVQFLHPRKVESLLTETIKVHLEQHITTKLASPFPTHAMYTAPAIPTADMPTSAIPSITTPSAQQPPFRVNPPLSELPFYDASPFIPTAKERPIDLIQTPVVASEISEPHVLGQLLQTYILIETDQGLSLIDQHAAHERILYEQIGKQLKKAESISLLFPEIIQLNAADYTLIHDQLEILAQFGICAQAWGNNQILIFSTPVFVKQPVCKDIVYTLVAALHEQQEITSQQAQTAITHSLQAMMACKAAVKAHDPLTQQEMISLTKQLMQTTNRLTCPHGRPTTWTIHLSEIERKFKRIG